MAKFKHKTNGVILTTENKFVIEQLTKSPYYAPYKKGAGSSKPAESKPAQPEAAADGEDTAGENEEQ